MMKILKWTAISFVGGLFLWNLLLFFYFKSVAEPRKSFLYPSYKTTSTPYASLDVVGYSQDYAEVVKVSMGEFAKRNGMKIDYGSFLQVHALSLILSRKDIRIRVMNLDSSEGYLSVFLYKEEFWDDLSKEEHRAFFDKLIQVFRNLGLQTIDMRFES